MGQMYVQLDGRLRLRSNTGLECKLSFKNNDSGPTRQSTFFKGHIFKLEQILKAAYGNWTSFFATCDVNNFNTNYDDWLEIAKQAFNTHLSQKNIPLIQGSKILWKSRPRPSNSSAMYNFTSFTFLLNDPSYITEKIASTDRAAENEKERLEVKQREARALMKKTQEKLPKWFVKQHRKSKDELLWIFTGTYWNREFDGCEDIY
ncbi:unnamed protein product [Gongylonema pulchrum]|uniref:Oxysterol-binding protein n=1 Tax=Gongylonema pulchrum TaxID=637853 RepID=A0A183EBU0_9BILA|nr:unnamed protein product [Gongylonema pulchrum]